MPMIIGTMQVVLYMVGANSLKGKRQVLRGLKERLANRFNISIAEIDYHDIWHSAKLGIAVVANEERYAQQVLDGALEHINGCLDARIVTHEITFY